jgi:hypothetical protein
MRIAGDSGNVGIGTTSPSTLLHVNGAADTTFDIPRTLILSNPGTIVSGLGAGIAFNANFDNNITGTYALIGGCRENATVSNSAGFLVFGTRPSGGGTTTERARIDSSGRLLVGTSTSRALGAERLVQIEGTSATTTNLSIVRNSADINPPLIVFGKTRGATNGSNTIVQNNDRLSVFEFRGADGSKFVPAAEIIAAVDGTPGTNDMPGRLVFSVTADGASSPTEALRISSNRAITVSDGGNVVLGTTTGTKIGTATTQKLGFYNATPVVQPAAVADATTAVDVITQLNDLLAKLRTLGIIAT